VTQTFIGLGANLGNSLAALSEAARKLERLALPGPLSRSRIYRSAPVGPQGQPDYLNAVVALQTRLEPHELLDELQAIEQQAGRERLVRWGPRTLDLDILIYGSTIMDSERLTLPHPRMFERNFVLRPLADLLGGSWQFTDGSTLRQRLDSCPDNALSLAGLDWATQPLRSASA